MTEAMKAAADGGRCAAVRWKRSWWSRQTMTPTSGPGARRRSPVVFSVAVQSGQAAVTAWCPARAGRERQRRARPSRGRWSLELGFHGGEDRDGGAHGRDQRKGSAHSRTAAAHRPAPRAWVEGRGADSAGQRGDEAVFRYAVGPQGWTSGQLRPTLPSWPCSAYGPATCTRSGSGSRTTSWRSEP